jgi:isoquinoline 1-oxidoreductase alpha subunit
MAMIEFKLNGKVVQSNSDGDTPLLWVVRDELNYKGTKFGCGIAQCGACTVQIDGQPTRSCSIPVSVIAGRDITTIEGLNSPAGSALKEAWVSEQVPQCGYCQSGQLVTAEALLRANESPNDEDISNAMNGNLCRCMAYTRIRKAIKVAAGKV